MTEVTLNISRILLGFTGVSTAAVASTAPMEGVWVKVAVACIGVVTALVSLMLGVILKHISNHNENSVSPELCDRIHENVESIAEIRHKEVVSAIERLENKIESDRSKK